MTSQNLFKALTLINNLYFIVQNVFLMFGLFVCFNLRKNEIQMGTHRVNFQSSIYLEFSVIFDVIFLLIFFAFFP